MPTARNCQMQSERRIMPCYEPNIRLASDMRLTKNGKWAMLDYINCHGSKFQGYEFYEQMNKRWKKEGVNAEYQRIPCKQCIGCKEDYAKEWATRIALEMTKYDCNWFVTFTYDDLHLPWDDTFIDPNDGEIYQNDGTWGGYLVPEHMTKFFKRLRERWERIHGHTGIRYFYCGEYGGTTERPHYHAIIFNLPIELDTLRIHYMEKATGYITYNCKEIEDLWGMGFVTLNEANWQTACYTAGYVQKKRGSCRDYKLYAEKGQTPEFIRMSRNGGIGKDYYEHHPEMYDNDEIIIHGAHNIIAPVKIPRYFDKIHEERYPEILERNKEKRKQKAMNNSAITQANTSLNIQEQLQVEKKTKEEKMQIFKSRNMDRIQY